jgi:hypothetical protein
MQVSDAHVYSLFGGQLALRRASPEWFTELS